MELLECKQLNKQFDDKPILKNINIKIPRGKIIGLLGKNGTGKTTLIKLINDLLTPTSGEILINGEKPGVNSKKIISYLPERTYLEKEMTIEQVIKYFEEFYANFNKEKAIKLLKDLDLSTELKLSKMSKGMQEKLQLILVMSREAGPVTQMLDSGMSIEEIIKTALKDFEVEVLDEGEAAYKCNCSRERVERALISTGREELKAMAEELPVIEVNCHFCDKKYNFTPKEILNLID